MIDTARKEKLYLDTSVPSAYFDERSPERKRATESFWKRIDDYDIYISNLVIEEIQATEEQDLKGRLNDLVSDFQLLEETDESKKLANAYIDMGIFPERFKDDGRHVAVATVNEVNYLVSWNFKHLVNVKTRKMASLLNLIKGYRALEIIAPPEL